MEHECVRNVMGSGNIKNEYLAEGQGERKQEYETMELSCLLLRHLTDRKKMFFWTVIPDFFIL